MNNNTLTEDDFYHEAADPYESGYIKQEVIDICLENQKIVERLKEHIKKYENISIGNTYSMIRLDELRSILDVEDANRYK